jgi:hypothetical protein
MTQISWQWDCDPEVGDFSPVTVERLANAFMLVGNTEPDSKGVVYWTGSQVLQGLGLANPSDGLLAATIPSAGVVRIASGVAMVEGWFFVSDDDVDFNINTSPGAANATDIIALRRSDIGAIKTVRLVRLNGAVSSVATLTQTATTWEIPLWYVQLDGAGALDSISDVRQYVNPLVEQKIVLIQETLGAGTILGTEVAVPAGCRAIQVVASGYRAGSADHSFRIVLNGTTTGYTNTLSYIEYSSATTNIAFTNTNGICTFFTSTVSGAGALWADFTIHNPSAVSAALGRAIVSEASAGGLRFWGTHQFPDTDPVETILVRKQALNTNDVWSYTVYAIFN